MDTPNPELMHIYGTDAYYLEKVGAFKDVLRLAAPLGWMGLLAHKNEEEEKHRAEAEAMNMALRAAEAERMRPTLEGFYGHGAPRQPLAEDYGDPTEAINELDHSLGKHGEAIGRSMARREFSKLAAGGMTHQFLQPRPAPAPAPVPAPPRAPGGPYRAPAPVSAGPPAPTGPITSIKDPRFQAAPGFVAGEGLSEFKTGPWQAKGQKLLNQQVPGAPKIPGGAPKVPTTGLRTPKVTPGKPWISTGTKMKGLGVLGAAAAAYGGYKLINKVKQKAEEPHMGGHAWGQASPPIYTGVGEYGHPVY